MMLDKDKIIAELATNYGIILNKEDPLLVAVLLNKIILAEYVNELDQHLAESITNVAIKEDVTEVKLHKLLNDNQIKNRQEIERILNQFTDNLQSRLQLINQPIPPKRKPTSWPAWLISAFLLGLLLGILGVKTLT
ncbi:MAG: hypothetical protein KKD05_08390 [Candidatus Omnitrophica bacterium]|nr:hypothetical protein [Candidatus Omnitrophota bacterium]